VVFYYYLLVVFAITLYGKFSRHFFEKKISAKIFQVTLICEDDVTQVTLICEVTLICYFNMLYNSL
jgi:hypothetical protein